MQNMQFLFCFEISLSKLTTNATKKICRCKNMQIQWFIVNLTFIAHTPLDKLKFRIIISKVFPQDICLQYFYINNKICTCCCLSFKSMKVYDFSWTHNLHSTKEYVNFLLSNIYVYISSILFISRYPFQLPANIRSSHFSISVVVLAVNLFMLT